jgi:hypothetical protein
MLKNEEIAYAAGFIDGEGCVDYKATNRGGWEYSYIRLRVNNTNEEVLLWLEKKFRVGSVTSRKVPIGNKPQWIWAVEGTPNVVSVLKLIEPYLIVKRKQVKEMLGYKYENTIKDNR